MLKLVRNNQRSVGTTTAHMSPDLLRLPQHIAIVMDGNGRWAKKRKLQRLFGHQQGVDAVKRAIDGVLDLGVPYLTLYTFSTENWCRPAEEVDGLMHLLDQTIRNNLDEFHRKGIRLKILGERDRLNQKLLDLMDHAVEKTKNNKDLTLSIALNYGGRTEIVQAAKRLAILVKEGKLDPEDITQDLLNAQMYTTGLPDPDLFIRTSNESRMSNFLLWQAAYTELVFIKTLWPDFTKNDLIDCILEFQRRERRFGGNGSDDV
jgi:undecaprenyl diphosphate synthase